MMTRFLIPTLLLVFALGTTVCGKPERKSDVSQLQELPQEIAANLKRIPDSDVLVSIAPIGTPSPAPTPKPTFALACSQTQDFWVQVAYPVTVCTRPELSAGDFMAPAPPKGSGPTHSTGATTVESYKLSSFEGKGLVTPYSCRTHNGPWQAVISRTLECSEVMTCSMVILGVPSCPSCPSFVWGGDNCEVNNRPASVQFDDTLAAKGPPRFSPCNPKTTCTDQPPPSPPPIH